jgi:hypothetical protein
MDFLVKNHMKFLNSNSEDSTNTTKTWPCVKHDDYVNDI